MTRQKPKTEPADPNQDHVQQKQHSDDGRFSDVHQAVEFVAERQQGLETKVEAFSGLKTTVESLESQLKDAKTELSELKSTLSTSDRSPHRRDLSTGGGDNVLTDC